MKYKLKNVSKIFESNKGKFTLNNISLSIKPNAINVIYGKSGSGKTTLLNILSSLDIEYNGSVTLENTSIKDLTEEERAELRLKKIGLVYQFFNLLPDLTIYENILLPNVILGKNNKEKCNELIEYLNLNTIINQLPVQCSGGGTSVLLLDPCLDGLSGGSSAIGHIGDGGDDLLCWWE